MAHSMYTLKKHWEALAEIFLSGENLNIYHYKANLVTVSLAVPYDRAAKISSKYHPNDSTQPCWRGSAEGT